ncbi:MAG: DUF4303 domain-containing protein [Pseudomonadota bacterium]
MARPNYSHLRRILATAASEALMRFADSADNNDVYAVVFDTNEEYGSVILSLNTESALAEWRSKTYPHYEDHHVYALHGLRYNPGDFTFMDYGLVSEAQRPWAEQFESYFSGLKSENARQKNLQQFSQAVVQALDDLAESFQRLNKTHDFVAFHCYHDATEETVERLVRLSVDPKTFDRVFPEIRANRELIDSVEELDGTQQAENWIECLDAYAFQIDSAFAREFFRNNLWLDVQPKLSEIGLPAVPPTMRLLDRVVLEPQFTVEGSEEQLAEGVFTRCANTAGTLLEVLRDVGFVDNEIERKLLFYFRSLHDRPEAQEDTIGTNLKWVATTLHSLIPQKYPMPDTMRVGGNHVANATAFIRDPDHG